MKIAFINGSPKMKDSASGCFLRELKAFLENESLIISEYHFCKPQLTAEQMKNLSECNILVFSFPLYVDGIPSHLLDCFVQLETFLAGQKEKKIKVYAMVNSGFYESRQNRLAIEMMKNWCEKSGLVWGQGVAIGAGAMLGMLKNVSMGYGPKKDLGKALKQLAGNILNCNSEENIFITANFPRAIYKFGAEMGWRQSIKANGLKPKDLFLRK